jgi:hypothetical protein
MRRRFPLKAKGKPYKEAACKAMVLSLKPVFFNSKNETVPYPNHFRTGYTSFPVILNFPFRMM